MIYLLAFILPISFFYSPRIEKKNIVLFTKPLTISQERNTPVYSLFQQTQLIDKKDSISIIKKLPPQQYSNLNFSDVRPINEKPISINTIKLSQTELNSEIDKKLVETIINDNNGFTISQISSSSNNLFLNQNQNLSNSQSTNSHYFANVIKGNFELKDGVGITDQIVTLKRVINNQIIEIGQINLNDGSYFIQTQDLEGELVAEIRDKSGILIGVDKKDLKISKLIEKQNQNIFQGPTLKVGKPGIDVSSININLKNQDDRKVKSKQVDTYLFSGLYALKNANDTYKNVSKFSSTLAVVKDLSLYNTDIISVRTTNDQTQTVIFKKSWLDGSLGYISDQLQIQFLPKTGVLIGKVTINGIPVTGAQVVLENQPGFEPIYLDEFFIPQKDQTSTSENGYFILPGLNPGAYQLIAYLNNKVIGHQLYFVESDVVTYQEIYSLGFEKQLTVSSIDNFNQQPIATEFQFPGIEDIISTDIGNTATIKYKAAFGQAEIINRPISREYANYIYLHNLNNNKMNLPQIKEDFFEYIASQNKISREPNTSLFVGFSKLESYSVYLSDEKFNKENIAFFDEQGRVSVVQSPGGGFIIFNIPEGIQEIILQEAKTEKSFSQAIFSRSDVVFVSNFDE